MTKPTVFVVNKSAHDFSPAERFGVLRYITQGNINPFNVSKMVRDIEDAFQDARPEDYILITSLTILCSIACAVFVTKFKCLNLLLFKDGKYIERKLTFTNMG